MTSRGGFRIALPTRSRMMSVAAASQLDASARSGTERTARYPSASTVARVEGVNAKAGSFRRSADHTGRRSWIAVGVVPSRQCSGRSSLKLALIPRYATNRITASLASGSMTAMLARGILRSSRTRSTMRSSTAGRSREDVIALATSTIDFAWEDRESLTASTRGAARDAVEAALDGLDSGRLRVAEKTAHGWQVHQWLKKAVLLSFRLNDMVEIPGGPTDPERGASRWCSRSARTGAHRGAAARSSSSASPTASGSAGRWVRARSWTHPSPPSRRRHAASRPAAAHAVCR